MEFCKISISTKYHINKNLAYRTPLPATPKTALWMESGSRGARGVAAAAVELGWDRGRGRAIRRDMEARIVRELRRRLGNLAMRTNIANLARWPMPPLMEMNWMILTRKELLSRCSPTL